MKVVVQVYLDTSDIQHEKLSLKLVSPVIPGFSVDSDPVEPTSKRSVDDEDEKPTKKLKKK